VQVAAADAEQARALLLPLAPEGLEEVEQEDGVELAVFGDAARAAAVAAVFPHARPTPVASGWEDAWKTFHRSVVAGGVWIGPPWEKPPPGRAAVVIDPGRAFGTGAHPTTRLCAELLAELGRGSLLDVGCGSGVLALVAGRLGFGPLLGVDVDPVAVEVAAANAAANGITLRARVVDATSQPLPAADLAVANIALEAVEGVLPRLSVREVVTSGYLAGERPAAPGWEHIHRRELDGWAADRFRSC
jgi:ribosomal protein L11 methyltransferase